MGVGLEIGRQIYEFQSCLDGVETKEKSSSGFRLFSKIDVLWLYVALYLSFVLSLEPWIVHPRHTARMSLHMYLHMRQHAESALVLVVGNFSP